MATPAPQAADLMLRRFDKTILGLYRVIHKLDRAAPASGAIPRWRSSAPAGSRRRTPPTRRSASWPARLSYMGCDIVTGGGPGLMRAANEGRAQGAYRYKTRSFGLTILLPMEEQPNPFLDEVAHHATFFSRLHQFIRLVPRLRRGGRRHRHHPGIDDGLAAPAGPHAARPVAVFVGPMWQGLRNWIESDIIGRGLASPGDLGARRLGG